jgi:very-short-patch-repair endonuclease
MAVDISGNDRIEVAGESFYRAALERIAAAGDPYRSLTAQLLPEPENPYDRNAVRVEIDGEKVGHLPRDLAALVAEALTQLAKSGPVTSRAELKGSPASEFGWGVVLSIDASRLGLVIEGEDEAGSVESVGPPVSDDRSVSPTVAATTNGRDEGRRDTIRRAVESWKTELIDLSGRNRLLYMRDLRAGTLTFDEMSRPALMELVGGKKVALSRLVSRSRPRDNPQAKLTPFEDAVRRMRTIVRTARTYAEERGVHTLYLACGVATWRSDRASRPPAAPVLLVPLEVKPRGASQQDFDLSLAGELEVNPTLLHLLKVEFNLDIDDRELHEHSEMDGVIDTPEELRLAFDWLTHKAQRVADWSISDQFVIGNFWYAKLPMVKDLEASIDLLATNDVASAFAGDADAKTAVFAARKDARRALGDVDRLAPAEEFNILDSDSSQSLAIARARSGENLVLRGPPGTGKSQTIANLICNAIGERKRVLFVAEKRAAIEAVTKRLDGVGLGDLVLDLHRGSESRKWLATQLGESLAAIGSSTPVNNGDLDGRLERARAFLREHAEALHEKRQPWGLSVFDAQMGVLKIGRPSVVARLRGPDLEQVRDAELDELSESLRDLLILKGLSLRATDSPWADSSVDTVEVAREAERLLRDASTRQAALLAKLASAPGISDGAVPPPANLAQADELLRLWNALKECAVHFDLALLKEDLTMQMTNLEPLRGSGFARFIAGLTSADFKTARAQVTSHLRDGESLGPSELFAALERCRDAQELWRQRASSDATPSFPDDLDTVEAEVRQLIADLQRIEEVVGVRLLALDFSEITSKLDELATEKDTLHALPRISSARGRFAESALSGFLQELEERQELLPEADDELRRLWWLSVVDHLMAQPAADGLVGFRGELHAQLAQEFKDFDTRHVEATAGKVSRIAAEGAVAAMDKFPDQAQLVLAQTKRKRGHMPIREFFSRAPDALMALRPCWVMSPLLVSQLIPSGRAYFDLVIFDEASQVRPVDALTSMIRGTQLVVAGDEHQLPPTVFFDASASGDEDADQDQDATEIADYESLLDVLLTFFDAEMLRWHYRSRDERLISFSNQEIYGGGLTTFPGVVSSDALDHVFVDELPEEGEPRVSPRAEVDRIVELVIQHAQDRPDESLGVIALGIRHADAIEEGLLAAMPEHPELEPFFAEDREERFFVKNLERVQGDERDAIILAVGYGRESDGTLPHRFGPLNNAGGERRLNVAVTRAKRRMTVVSSFKAEAIDERRSSAKGVHLLRDYLEYASRGGEATELDTDAGLETPVHAQIATALESAGLASQQMIGASSDRIDVAVLDPVGKEPKIAIEMDGASYAGRPSVRDRDRLRPEQLERLGWRHVNTWTQDWYRDPAGAAGRLVDQVEEAIRSQDGATAAGDETADQQNGAGDLDSNISDRGPRPSFPSGRSAITDWPLPDLVRLGKWIESDGKLRTEDDLKTELMQELGITRRGSRVIRVLDEVVAILRA